MKLYQFNEWYQQAVDYWSNSSHTDCPEKCLEKLQHLKSVVDSYFSNTKDEFYIWFKRVIPTILSLRMAKFHTRIYKVVGYDENGQPKLEKPDDLPEISTNATSFKELLGAFSIDLPDVETLFSTHSSGSGDKCQNLDTSKVDQLINKIAKLSDEDLDRIFAFINSLDETDRSLYMMFKSNELHVETDHITMRELAIEAGLDDVVSVYKWVIPGFNS